MEAYLPYLQKLWTASITVRDTYHKLPWWLSSKELQLWTQESSENPGEATASH